VTKALESSVGSVGSGEFCFAHSATGLARLEEYLRGSGSTAAQKACGEGLLLYGALPLTTLSSSSLSYLRTLAIVGTRDGLVGPMSVAMASKRAAGERGGMGSVVFLEGASHTSLFDKNVPGLLSKLDFLPSSSREEVLVQLTSVAREWVRGSRGPVLQRFADRSAQIAAPLVKALELEGSSALGNPACNSDFPTNPVQPSF